MISVNEVKTITKYGLEKRNKSTEDFCNNILSQLITDQAKKGGSFLKFGISKDTHSFQYRLIVKIDIKTTNLYKIKTTYYYNVPSIDRMQDILLDAGYAVDITTYNNSDSIWTVRWDDDSNRELEGESINELAY